MPRAIIMLFSDDSTYSMDLGSPMASDGFLKSQEGGHQDCWTDFDRLS